MPRSSAGDVWVFGYGSLMWRPGFVHDEVRPARVHGYHRALCVWSHHHRGTSDRPGLVLGLDMGGSCKGLAFRVKGEDWPEALQELNRRELLAHPHDSYDDVYEPRFVCATFEDGERVPCFVYVVNRRHPQYAPRQSVERVAAVIAGAEGKSGPNIEYVANTVDHLDALGIPDGPLHAVMRVLEEGSKP